jgi:hypothetical protein
LAQTIVPFGVGAIFDILGESLVACDTHLWSGRGNPIRLRRLEKDLGVNGFKAAPAYPGLQLGQRRAGIHYMRFPQWLFCQRCRRMYRWNIDMERQDETAECLRAGCNRSQLVPMRFVVVCSNGHLDDVPWHIWAHFGAKEPSQKQCHREDKLRFISRREVGAGLESLIVECEECHASRSLQGLPTSGSLRPLGIRCRGRQPWQFGQAVLDCAAEPEVVQRGASNVYFGLVVSAIDIPPDSNYSPYSELVLCVTNHSHFAVLRSNPDGPIAERMVEVIAGECSCSPVDVMGILREELKADSTATTIEAAEDLAAGEWRAFQIPHPEIDDRSKFVTKHVPFRPSSLDDASTTALGGLDDLIDQVVLATKLREVRVLKGFTRYRGEQEVRPDLGRNLGWLPAIEVYGEGLFISLNEEMVSQWESIPAVAARSKKIEDRRRINFVGERLPQATPRFVLLHTLAHLMIRQLAFDCGYAAASLRERVYSREPSGGQPQAGVLIFTAAGDSEGTLGGLVRQGEPPRLALSVLSALQTGFWCSSDPICIESDGQGFGAMNLGACHACSLISETSCVYANALLDRGLVLGGAVFDHGFFAKALDLAIDVVADR